MSTYNKDIIIVIAHGFAKFPILTKNISCPRHHPPPPSVKPWLRPCICMISYNAITLVCIHVL